MIRLEISAFIESKIAELIYWLCNKFVALINLLFSFLPNDPQFLNEIDMSVFDKYWGFICYFVPMRFISFVLLTSVSLFMFIEIALLTIKIIKSIIEKAAESWAIFFA